MQVYSYNPLVNSNFQSNPEKDRGKFLNKIACINKKLENRQDKLPRIWEVYTPLQVAIALGELEKCKQLVEDKENLSTVDLETDALYKHPCGLALICDQQDVLYFLYDKLSPKVKRQILDCVLETEDIFTGLWQRTPQAVKQNFIKDVRTLPIEDIPTEGYTKAILSLLFNDASKDEQIKLLHYFARLPNVFIYLWSLASEEVRTTRKKGYSWIHKSIYEESKPLITFFLDQGMDVRTVALPHLTPFNTAVTKRNIIGESLYRRLEVADAGFSSDFMKIRLFCSQFSLKVAFEGFCKTENWNLKSAVIDTLVKEKQFRALASPRKLEELTDSFKPVQDESPEVLYTQSQTKWAALLDIGWEYHSVGAIFTSTLCVKINTGTGDRRGINFYTIRNRDQKRVTIAIKTLLDNTKAKVTRKVWDTHFDRTLDKKLDLKHVLYFKYEQITGNCSWMVHKLGLLTLLMLQEIEGTKEADAERIMNAFEVVNDDFQLWYVRNCEESIKEAVPLMRKYPQHFNTLELLTQAFKNVLKDATLYQNYKEYLLERLLAEEPQLKDSNPIIVYHV